jgi:hypothetical protein
MLYNKRFHVVTKILYSGHHFRLNTCRVSMANVHHFSGERRNTEILLLYEVSQSMEEYVIKRPTNQVLFFFLSTSDPVQPHAVFQVCYLI